MEADDVLKNYDIADKLPDWRTNMREWLHSTLKKMSKTLHQGGNDKNFQFINFYVKKIFPTCSDYVLQRLERMYSI